jgi:glycosyltransferase involved in cell wall biosynthesis
MKSNSLFISQIVPDSLVEKLNCSPAANNFCMKISATKHFQKHISIPPLNVTKKFKEEDKDRNILYYTFRFLPHVSMLRYINSIMENIWLYFYILKSEQQNIWYYNIFPGDILSYWLLKIFSRKHIYVLLADFNSSRYPKLLSELILFSLKKAKGVISLSGRCYSVNSNFHCIPGIIMSDQIRFANRPNNIRKKFLLSGTLNRNLGLFMAIDSFKLIPDVELIISGRINESDKLLLKNYDNIKYTGFTDSYVEYCEILNQTDFILSFRDPDAPVNFYNFPSKILEALSLNIPVISTIKYPELEGINYLYVEYDVNSIVRLIKKIVKGEMEILNNSIEVIENKFSEKIWIAKFNELECCN